MTSLNRRRATRALSVAGLAAAVVLAVSGFANAEPEAKSVIKACVDRQTGDVRIPNPPRENHDGCARGEQNVVWNVRGPQGPAGPPGITGARVIAVTEAVPANSSDESIVAECPDGLSPTGGGFERDTDDVLVDASAPLVASGGIPVGWRATFSNPTDVPGRGTVYVVCYLAAN